MIDSGEKKKPLIIYSSVSVNIHEIHLLFGAFNYIVLVLISIHRELPHPFGLGLPTSMLMVLVSAAPALFFVDYQRIVDSQSTWHFVIETVT